MARCCPLAVAGRPDTCCGGRIAVSRPPFRVRGGFACSAGFAVQEVTGDGPICVDGAARVGAFSLDETCKRIGSLGVALPSAAAGHVEQDAPQSGGE
jgi:hypothetical protein